MQKVGEKMNNRVGEFRTKLSITQEELAEKTGVTRQTIIAIEKGNYVPSLALAFALSNFFKKSIEDIFYQS